MGYQSWHNYGYGLCVSEIPEPSVEQLKHFLQLAPCYNSQINAWLEEQKISTPTYEDYLKFDDCYCLGLATLMAEVIEEAEGIGFTACSNYDGDSFLIYMPSYPWELPEQERCLTEERISDILSHYVSLLTDEAPSLDYQSVENGG